MIRIWKVDAIRLSFFFVIILFLSCEKKEFDLYYYKIYDDKETVKGYYKRFVFINNNLRIDSIIRYDKQNSFQEKKIEKIKLTPFGIELEDGKKYLSKTIDECYDSVNFLKDTIKTCYKGKVSIVLNENEYSNISKFYVSSFSIDGVSKNKFFDKNFILLREEYVDGFAEYYRIDRVARW